MDKDILKAAEEWAVSQGMDPHSAGKVLAQMEASDFVVFCNAAAQGDYETMSDIYNNTTKIDETFNSSIDNPASQFQAKPGKGTNDHGAENHMTAPEAPTAPQPTDAAGQMSQLSQQIATIQQGPDGQPELAPVQQQQPQPASAVQPDATGAPDIASPEEVAQTVDLNDPEVQRILKLAGGGL